MRFGLSGVSLSENGFIRLTERDPEDGERHLVISDFEIEPFTYEQLAKANPEQMLDVVLSIRRGRIHETSVGIEPIPGSVSTTLKIPTSLKCQSYGLIAGGWMPPGLYAHRPCVFTLDRCSYGDLVEIVRKKGAAVHEADFLGWLARPGTMINYGLVVLEGSGGRQPTVLEMCAYAQHVHETLRAVLPQAILLPGAAEAALGSANLAAEPALSHEREIDFLRSIHHHLRNQVPIKRRNGAVAEIVAQADEHGLPRLSYLCLAAISTVLCDPGDNPARKMLKVDKLLTASGAYNALSDLRALKIHAELIGMFPEHRPIFCTSDKSLAKFWVATNPRNFRRTNNRTSYDVDYHPRWFPGLDTALLSSG